MPQFTAISLLKFATFILIILGGLVLAMASHPATAFLPNMFIDLVFLPFDGAEKANEPASRLLAAIGGGVLVGMGITFWLIVTKLMPREPQLAKSIITAGLIGWFVVDSTGSTLSGAWFNVASNCAILACFLIPLNLMRLEQ